MPTTVLRFMAAMWASASLAAALCPNALAQDINIQSRLDALAPEPTPKPPEPRHVIEKVEKRVPVFATRDVDVTEAEMRKALKDVGVVFAARPNKQQVLAEYIKTGKPLKKKETYATAKTKVVGFEEKTVLKAPAPETEISLPVAYTFDSNVFTRNTNVVSDRYFLSVPSVTMILPYSLKDAFALTIGTSISRYDKYAALDRDILFAQLSHTTKLSEFQKDPASKTVQREFLRFRVLSRSVYEPGFSPLLVQAYTPSVDWSLGGIPIGQDLCGPAGQKVNCYTAAIGAELNRTIYESISASDNTTLKLRGTLAWNIWGSALIWSITGSVADRYFDRSPTDRNDIILAAETALIWNASPNFTLSATVGYTNQTSSLPTAEYDGYILQPQIKGSLKF